MTIEEAVMRKLTDALDMKETIYSLKYIERKIKTNYNTTNVDKFLDINLIKQGFDAYKSNQFDELYFKVWCKLVSKIYKIKYDQILHNWMDESEFDRKQVGYKIIAKLVRNAPDSTNLDQVFAEIGYHYAVLVGKEPCNYPLVQDFEFFECAGNVNYLEVLQINHFQKTYFYTDTFDEYWEENFNMDFDDYYEKPGVNMYIIEPPTFYLLKDALKQAGYRETDNFFMIENACNLYE